MYKVWIGSLIILTGVVISMAAKYASQRKAGGQAAVTQPTDTSFQKLSEKPELVKVPILIYHYVEYVKDEKDTIRKSLNINPDTFEKQLQTLLNNSYTFIFVDELADYLDGKASLPPKPIIITFDDGYGDFYTDVLPILKKYNVKATIYVVPGFLDKLNAMTSQQIQEVANSGFVEIAAHTVHHRNLENIFLESAEKEMVDSKIQLEKLLGKGVNNFAYPYGGFNQEIIKLSQKAGYRTAATDAPGSYQADSNRYALYRLKPGARTDKELIDWLESLKP